jgi:hypothetical protein
VNGPVAGRQRYSVTYFDPATGKQKVIPVAAPTQAEIALYATSGDQGLWLSVWEKGYVQMVSATVNLGWRNGTAYDVIGVGQYPKDVIPFLTGQTAAVNQLQGAADPKNALTAVRKALMEKELVTATSSVGAGPWNPTRDVPPNHTFTVLSVTGGVNPTLTLQNPWMVHQPGMIYGGTFTMLWNLFIRKFGYVTTEQKR